MSWFPLKNDSRVADLGNFGPTQSGVTKIGHIKFDISISPFKYKFNLENGNRNSLKCEILLHETA
jgi:hypothetical protein